MSPLVFVHFIIQGSMWILPGFSCLYCRWTHWFLFGLWDLGVLCCVILLKSSNHAFYQSCMFFLKIFIKFAPFFVSFMTSVAVTQSCCSKQVNLTFRKARKVYVGIFFFVNQLPRNFVESELLIKVFFCFFSFFLLATFLVYRFKNHLFSMTSFNGYFLYSLNSLDEFFRNLVSSLVEHVEA